MLPEKVGSLVECHVSCVCIVVPEDSGCSGASYADPLRSFSLEQK